ncbi:hypothetical protein EBR57_06790, partial [bacterium]|nr:hypothetical protein [bacterium]
ARVHENRTWIDGTAGVVGLVIGLAIAAAAAKSKASLENRRLTALANASYALMPQDEDVSAAGYKLIGQDDGKVFTGNPTKGFKEDRFAKANHVIPTLIHDGCAARDQIEFEKTLSDLTDIVIGKMDWTGANGSHKDGAARAVVIGLLSKIHQLLNLARDGVMGEEDRCAKRDPRNFKYPIALPETLPAGVLSDKDGWSQNDTILSILEHAVNQVERTGWKDWATSFGQKPAYEVSKADEYLKKRLDFTPGIRPIDLEEVGLHVGEPLDGLQAV